MASQEAMAAGFGALLVSDQSEGSFYDDVGGRIYEMVAPEEAPLPLAVWNIITDPPDEMFGGDDIDAEIQVDLYGEKSLGIATLGAINDKLFTLLQGQSATITGYDGVSIQCMDRGAREVEERAYRITSRWRLMANTE